MKLLVTGGAGFIGSNFVRYQIAHDPSVEVTTLDALTYAGNLANLEPVRSAARHRFVHGDVTDREAVFRLLEPGVDAIVHFAAESHVDRSIEDSAVFLRTNVLGTQVMLEGARRCGVKRFLHISTDEVYGSLGPEGRFTEESPLRPSSPYAASKAAADAFVQAYAATHGVPGVITRCSNNYGPYQFPEKLIPLFVTNALDGLPLPLYGDGLHVRDWIHVEDHVAALWHVLGLPERGGVVYNVGAENEMPNRAVAERILALVGRPASLVRPVTDRLGHDRRYALDATRLRATGWRPRRTFHDGLAATVAWYRERRAWWEPLKR